MSAYQRRPVQAFEDEPPEPPGATGQYPDRVWAASSSSGLSARARAAASENAGPSAGLAERSGLCGVSSSNSATKIDGGAIDRIIGRFAARVRVVRVHTAAAATFRGGAGHLGFNDLEHVLGLSRTFRVDADHACCIADLVDALNQLDRVEYASPYYLCALPFHQPAPDATPDLEHAWISRDQIGAAEAMAYEPGDPAVITAVVDTGVAMEHPELRGRLRAGFDTVELGTRDLANGVQLLGDRTEADTDPADEVGHGTACAAIIARISRRVSRAIAACCRCVCSAQRS